MFYQERYQTGEISQIIDEMKKGNIPCMDVNDNDELNWFIKQLETKGIYKIEGLPYDINARDRVKEPEFEYRIAFHTSPVTSAGLEGKAPLHIDFYFEPVVDRTYDPVGEM
ncbi:MAG: hypothetical protein K0R50_764 [Eubacterium sp.]|jgi:hypothetical protein|nr:hypothetical protein [Eubacterium sp.]